MEHSLLHRKEGLIISSIDIIHELGIQGLSTREIAKRQGISEGTIFRHYKTKNDLILAVLDHYAQYDNEIIQSIRLKKYTPIEAITFFIGTYAEYYENYPAITSIELSYDFFLHEASLVDKIKDIYNTRCHFIKGFIEEAQHAGHIDYRVNSEQLANVIIGSFSNLCLKWRLQEYSFQLKEDTLHMLDMVVQAFGEYK